VELVYSGSGRWRALLAAGACALGGAAHAADSDRDQLAALRAEIVRLIGPAACANLVHCRAVALGSRSCGGPAEYLPYSSFGTNRELIEAKAFEYNLLYEEVEARQKAVAACAVLPEPRLQCIDRHCRIENQIP
jgi:hypothetical protein